jgi:hypothetical protein
LKRLRDFYFFCRLLFRPETFRRRDNENIYNTLQYNLISLLWMYAGI